MGVTICLCGYLNRFDIWVMALSEVVLWVYWLSGIGFYPKNGQKRVDSYGMELARVGAFTENRGS